MINGILLIHGFCGARDEIRPLYNWLLSENYEISMPVLTGHEQDNKILSKAKYKDWINDVTKAYEALEKKCNNITVIGFSMGGLLACMLYKKHRFERLITINTPIYYWDIKRILLNLSSDPKKYLKKYFRASTNKPFNSLIEFVKLLNNTKKDFSKIECPALVIQALDDDTVNIKSGDYIYKSLKSREKKIYSPEKGGHIILTSDYHTDILEKIQNFIK